MGEAHESVRQGTRGEAEIGRELAAWTSRVEPIGGGPEEDEELKVREEAGGIGSDDSIRLSRVEFTRIGTEGSVVELGREQSAVASSQCGGVAVEAREIGASDECTAVAEGPIGGRWWNPPCIGREEDAIRGCEDGRGGHGVEDTAGMGWDWEVDDEARE